MKDLILLLFPMIVIGILLYKVKISQGSTLWGDCWNRDDAKSMQVFAAFGVILHHLAQLISNYDKIAIGPIQIMTSMGILFTSIFFFYSGFGLMQSIEKKDDYLKDFLFNRMSVVLVPFLLTNILYILPGFAEGRITSVYGLCTSILGLTLINTNAWYLVEIMIFYMVFYCCFKWIKNRNIALRVYIGFIVGVIIVAVFLGHDFSELNGHWFMGEWWFNSTFVFVMGLLVGKYRDATVDFYKKYYVVKLIISILLFFVSFYVEEKIRIRFGYYHETHFYYNYGEKFITLGAQIITCVLFMQMILLITMKLRFYNVVLKRLSFITLELYLVQDFCMQYFDYESEIPHFLIYAIVIVDSILLAAIVYFADKYILNLIREYRCGNLSNATSYEGKQKQQKIRKRMKVVAIFYAVVLLITPILFTLDMYHRFIVDPSITRDEIEIIKQADLYDEVKYGRIEAPELHEKNLPITWIVVEKEDDRALLVSKYAIFSSYFHKHHKDCSYLNSDIRKDLNDDFLYIVFRKKELEHILTNESTEDKAFLLTKEEVSKYLPSDDMRKLTLLEMSVKMNENNIYKDKSYWWWLRSEDINQELLYVPVVDEKGSINEDGIEVNRSNGKIRPAIWVDLNNRHKNP